MKELTARQTQVLDFVKRRMEETGFPPTRVEIAKGLGFSSANAAEEHLKALHRKRAINLLPGISRGIRVLNRPTELPIVGRVAAGDPILAEEHIEDYCEVSPNAFHTPADFLLRVKGDSMIECGIHNGDLLAVKSVHEADNHSIVVARLGDEVTVKRLKKHRSKHQVTLLPENRTHAPIEVDLRVQEFVIEGIGVGLFRPAMM